MSGKKSRSKGRRGESAAKDLLTERDWNVCDLTAGLDTEDLFAISPDGITYAVEVKNCKSITTAHRDQAMEQAKERKARWMLISHIEGTSSWLVQRQGVKPIVWNKGD